MIVAWRSWTWTGLSAGRKPRSSLAPVVTADNRSIPLRSVAEVSVRKLPEMIRNDSGSLAGYVYVDFDTSKTDVGSYVEQAKKAAELAAEQAKKAADAAEAEMKKNNWTMSIAIVAGIFRLDEIAELANAGTLLAFIAVGACLMVLRRRAPEAKRLFRCPQPYLVGTLAILGCIYLLFKQVPGLHHLARGLGKLLSGIGEKDG